jgi:hypothetical protein
MYRAAVSTLVHLWQSFLALHPWGYLLTAVLALFALIKRKAIGAVSSAAWKRCDLWFWEKVRTKLQIQPPASQAGETHLKTYRGTFQWHGVGATTGGFVVALSNNGFSEKIPVEISDLFAGVKQGQFIEVETEATVGKYHETVKRVRVEQTT